MRIQRGNGHETIVTVESHRISTSLEIQVSPDLVHGIVEPGVRRSRPRQARKRGVQRIVRILKIVSAVENAAGDCHCAAIQIPIDDIRYVENAGFIRGGEVGQIGVGQAVGRVNIPIGQFHFRPGHAILIIRW